MRRSACNAGLLAEFAGGSAVARCGRAVVGRGYEPVALFPVSSVSRESFSRDAASGFALRYRAVAPLKQAGRGAGREPELRLIGL